MTYVVQKAFYCFSVENRSNAPLTSLSNFKSKQSHPFPSGDPIIHKSSGKSPISIAQYGELVKRAGFPSGVINILTGDCRVGALLLSHMEIAKVVLTGSSAAGRAAQIAAAKSNLKEATLEFGGRSPVLIFKDANVPNAVSPCCNIFLPNSGHICFASSRVFVHARLLWT